tara:strand:- start:341 stop:1261 length:921 start_codon:yes stop_codon:yes gene_type:complete
MAKKIKDIGVGYHSSKNIQSFVNDDGSSNILHNNREQSVDDLYSYLIGLTWSRFFLLVFLGYILINSFFACVYLAIGIEELTAETQHWYMDFLNAFFFSAQTITTVGYGSISPNGIVAGLVSSLEALVGLLSFSFITGLLYGRFSKPKSSIRFSENMVLRPFEEGRALMFRLVNNRTSIMIEPQVKVTMTLSTKQASGAYKRSFYELKMERDSITYLPTIWTLVHKIDDKSPLHDFTDEEIASINAKIYILFQYHEDSFSQKVYKIHAYDFDKILVNRQFKPTVTFSDSGQMILDHELLNTTEAYS